MLTFTSAFAFNDTFTYKCNMCKMVMSTKTESKYLKTLLCNELPEEYSSICDYHIQNEYQVINYYKKKFNFTVICSKLKYC